ncbi:MAG: putative ATX1-antioxidant protein and metal homeostasis factor [Benniella sp.]|nr:MAG: putative ATX1-antioxidant protein and metal homeostasis factor [Benniella sp.]
MPQYKFNVTMSCGGCSGAVTKALQRADGIDSFEVSLENQSVTVDSSTLEEAAILKVIQGTGKQASIATA